MPSVDYGAQVESNMASIKSSSEICQENKKRIAEFKRDLKLAHTSDARIQKVTSHLKIMAEHLGPDGFEDLEKDDIKDLVEWLHDRDISPTTVSDYKKVVKQFYKWLEGDGDEYPHKVDWITTTRPNGNNTLPKDLLTREDIDALKDACRNARDRAFIAILYETGARIGELIDLVVRDIEDHRHGRKVVIDGKTGQRRLPLLESSPALNKWLNEHPSGFDYDPLWCQLQDSSAKLSYHYIRQKLLPRAGRRAAKRNPTTFAENPDAVENPDERLEFYKPLNPHHFRHSRATELAQKFKEAQLCEWFGWVQGSKTPGKYVHLSGRDIDDAYGELHGLQPQEDETEQTIVTCWRCEDLNEAADRFCGGCGAALDVEAATEVETAQESSEDLIVEVDNEVQAKILRNIQRELRENPEEYVAAKD